MIFPFTVTFEDPLRSISCLRSRLSTQLSRANIFNRVNLEILMIAFVVETHHVDIVVVFVQGSGQRRPNELPCPITENRLVHNGQLIYNARIQF